MKVNVNYLQEGGPVPAPAPGPEAAPAGGPPAGPEGGQDPLMQIAQVFAQGLQAQDCQALAQGAQMFLELISQAQGGSEGGSPPEEPTVMKKGGKFILKSKKDKLKGKEESPEMAKKGAKMKKKC